MGEWKKTIENGEKPDRHLNRTEWQEMRGIRYGTACKFVSIMKWKMRKKRRQQEKICLGNSIG